MFFGENVKLDLADSFVERLITSILQVRACAGTVTSIEKLLLKEMAALT